MGLAVKGLGFLQLRIFQLLGEAQDGMLTREIIAATRANPGCVTESLRRLRDRGLVQRLHHGWWGLA